jgi:RNA polymerase sigma-70 factor (ECF subfamily)
MKSVSPAGASPSPEVERELHQRLLAGDVLASSELADAYLRPLVQRLRRYKLTSDAHLVETAAIDAVLATAQHPERYDPARASLTTYLAMAARGDLLNAIQKGQRRAAHQTDLKDVELGTAGRNVGWSGDDPAEEAVRRVDGTPAFVATVRGAFDDQEWAVVELMLEGQRRPVREYARLLGLEHLATDEQARAVKRVKDRLEKRLRRLAPEVRRDE